MTPSRLAHVHSLADAFVEDILAMSDEEILAELIEDGREPLAEAEEMRQIFEKAEAP